MANEVGSLYRSSLAVTDVNGDPVDTVTQVLTITLPDATTVTPSATHDSTGDYHVDYQFVQEGLHVFHWLTTSPNTSKTDYVNASMFRSVISLDEAKDFVNYGNSTNEDILRQIMAAATELAENVVGSCVQRTLTNVTIPGVTKSAIRLPKGPLPTTTAVTSISSMLLGGTTWLQSNGDFVVSPDSGVVYLSGQSPFVLGPWRATYTVGRLVVPQAVQLAVKEIIYDMWSTQRPYGADELEPGPEATARFEQMVSQYVMPAHASSLLGIHEMPGFA
jgi:hypothetical protein